MGVLGTQAEMYFGGDRLSIFGGLGYTPAFSEVRLSGVAGAAGIRIFTNGARHRGFLELSISQVLVQWSTSVEYRRFYYGPGIQVGYQYVALSGFTFMVSAGAGVPVSYFDIVGPSYFDFVDLSYFDFRLG